MSIRLRNLHVVSNSTTTYGVYEHFERDPNKDGIYYFEIAKNTQKMYGTNQGNKDEALKRMDNELRSVVQNATRIIPSSTYGDRLLRIVTLDVEDGTFVSISLVPEADPLNPNSDEVLNGRIENRTFAECPIFPLKFSGTVREIITTFNDSRSIPRLAIKVYLIENPCGDDEVTSDGHG